MEDYRLFVGKRRSVSSPPDMYAHKHITHGFSQPHSTLRLLVEEMLFLLLILGCLSHSLPDV